MSWDAVPRVADDDDTRNQEEDDPYDSDAVYEYHVSWSPKSQRCSATRGGSAITADQDDTAHTITGLTNYCTYNVRVQAIRPSGSNPSTPTLTSTPGLAGPPVWPVDTDEDVADPQDPLYSSFYGRITARWNDPHGDSDDGIQYYLVQWGTSRSNWSTTRQVTVDEADDNTYTIRGLSNGTHSVRVQAVGTNGPGTYSLTESLRLASTRPSPGQPTEVTLNTTGTARLCP